MKSNFIFHIVVNFIIFKCIKDLFTVLITGNNICSFNEISNEVNDEYNFGRIRQLDNLKLDYE